MVFLRHPEWMSHFFLKYVALGAQNKVAFCNILIGNCLAGIVTTVVYGFFFNYVYAQMYMQIVEMPILKIKW